MMYYDDFEGVGRKLICHNCVGEPFLSSLVLAQGKMGVCCYCGLKDKLFIIKELSEYVEVAFEQHYVRTPDQPTSYQQAMISDREMGYDWERDGQESVYAIMDAAEITEEIAHDIQTVLENEHYDFDSAAMGEETNFSSDAYYESAGVNDQHWQEEWRGFERFLKTETRFYSRSGFKLLASIFDGIDKMETFKNRPLIIEAGPNTALTEVFRARSFQSNSGLEKALARPDLHIGPPPSCYANAGRMNAHGISVFYGANDPKVALAEVRPPVGCQVAVARFEITKLLKLLDLTALEDIATSGSIFDPGFIKILERTSFLRSLSQRITVPVMPDNEKLEYLATQAVADFLASENDPTVDGILFPSVQDGHNSSNIVLFHKSSRVEEINYPKDTIISTNLGMMDEDGWVDDYSVFVETPVQNDFPKENEFPEMDVFHSFVDWESTQSADFRTPTLKVDLNSIEVHRIKSVKYKFENHSVRLSVRVKQSNVPF